VLLHIPRGGSAEHALLRVVAEAHRLGGSCDDIYFQKLTIAGSWALAKKRGGYVYVARRAADETPEWLAFGKVKLKVVHGKSQSGINYLNIYAKHLGQSGFPVGGLLGDDDHTDAATPPASCVERVGLQSQSRPADKNEHFVVSTAIATYA